MRRISLVNPTTLGVSFPYNEFLIQRIKGLKDRRWNSQTKLWEVHIAQLEKVLQILRIPPTLVPKEIWQEYKSKWSSKTATLSVDNCKTVLTGGNLPIDELDYATSFKLIGAEHSAVYKEGKWDGMKHLMRKDDGYVFPTGLLETIKKILKNKKHEINIVDNRKPSPEVTQT